MLYEYLCVVCGHEFEANMKIDERETAPCPACGGQGEKQIRTMPGVELKGEGWPGKKNKAYSSARK